MIIHIIVNSHLDPVWLWKKEQGIDAVLATAETACNALDEFPQLHITRGEAWFYEIVQKMNPILFERIRNFVTAGRWHIVGGWYIQPDCNQAAPEVYLKHGEISQAYFMKEFGVKVRTGFNVDSFGHSADLPDLYNANGIENYVYMRPNTVEMPGAPNQTFLWTTPAGGKLRTFRIAGAYTTNRMDPVPSVIGNIEATIKAARPGQKHTMCFIGIGDHGGGPAKEEIRWVLKHLNYRRGIKLKFSHPDAFFDTLSEDSLSQYSGELQHHAIGCYSAVSRMKRKLADTVDQLLYAENHLQKRKSFWENNWKKILFATFHDLLPGSSISSAYDEIIDELGSVQAHAKEALVQAIRIRNSSFPDAGVQRLIFDNVSSNDFSGSVECDPWITKYTGNPWLDEPFCLETESGKQVPYQIVTQEARTPVLRIALPLSLKAHSSKILYLKNGPAERTDAGCHIVRNKLTAPGLKASFGKRGIASLNFNSKEFLAEETSFAIINDITDTWSHRISAYTEPVLEFFKAERKPGILENASQGLVAELKQHFVCKKTELDCIMRADSDTGMLKIKIRVNWNRAQQMLKMLIKPNFAVQQRIDAVPGGTLERKLNGEEYPFYRYMTLTGKTQSLTIVSRTIFSFDVQPDGMIRLMLLRSPYYAHHEPTEIPPVHFARATDQGEHDYEITLIPGKKFDDVKVRQALLSQFSPVYFSELTR